MLNVKVDKNEVAERPREALMQGLPQEGAN